MHEKLQQLARKLILEGLEKLPVEWVEKFKLMYGHGGLIRGKAVRSVEEMKALSSERVVDEIPHYKLDWALSQVEKSIEKLEKQNGNQTPI